MENDIEDKIKLTQTELGLTKDPIQKQKLNKKLIRLNLRMQIRKLQDRFSKL